MYIIYTFKYWTCQQHCMLSKGNCSQAGTSALVHGVYICSVWTWHIFTDHQTSGQRPLRDFKPWKWLILWPGCSFLTSDDQGLHTGMHISEGESKEPNKNKHITSWLITYFQCTCNSPMKRDYPCSKKQGPTSMAFHSGCYDHSIICITVIRAA
jgi:hypothetical protein